MNEPTLTWRELAPTVHVCWPFRITAARMPDSSLRWNLYRGGVYVDKRGTLKECQELAESTTAGE